MHRFSRRAIAAALAHCVFTLSHAATSLPADAEKFKAVSFTRINELAGAIQSEAIAALISAVQRDGCPADEIKLYRSNTTATKVVTINCFPPERVPPDDPRQSTYISYPLTYVVSKKSAREVDFSEYTFMYETGHIDAITDLDRDSLPEFWLSGAICECDGDPSDAVHEECDCDITKVREFNAGKLVKWARSVKAR